MRPQAVHVGLQTYQLGLFEQWCTALKLGKWATMTVVLSNVSRSSRAAVIMPGVEECPYSCLARRALFGAVC